MIETVDLLDPETELNKVDVTERNNPRVLLSITERDGDGIQLSDGRTLPYNWLEGPEDRQHSNIDLRDPMGNAIRSYHYFDHEVDLLRRNMNAIWAEIQTDRGEAFEGPIAVLELGTGHDKFHQLYVGAVSTSSPGFNHLAVSDVILVDRSKERLDDARDRLSGLRSYLSPYSEPNQGSEDQRIHDINTDFHGLEEALEITGVKPVLTTYLGQTFGNFTPEENYGFLRATGAEYCLVGVYLLPEDKAGIDNLLINYSNLQTRFQTEISAHERGLGEDEIADCRHGAEISIEDWSEEYGEGFEEVAKVKWFMETGEGERPVDNYSMRYTRDQFRDLAKQNDYRVVHEFRGEGNGKEVALFLLRRC